MKSKSLNFYLATIISILFVSLYLWAPDKLERFNNNFIDMFFNIRGEKDASKDIIIIDVDEKSLQELGHWPWRRDKIARVIDNLTALGVGVIGYDMVFAEADHNSPRKVLKDFNISVPNALDYDEIFATSIASSPSILGMVFNFEQNFSNGSPNLGAIFLEKNKLSDGSLLKAKGVTSNIELFRDSAYSSGSFNMFPDSDGVVRHVPMIFSYDDMIYPSISLEIIRVASGLDMVDIVYDDRGVESIFLGDLQIPTDGHGQLFVNFVGKKNSYKYISALDIYHNRVSKEEIEGKIALLGTSAAGMLDLRATPFDTTIAGVEIHANVIDNIINDNFIQKPFFATSFDVFIIIVLAFLSAFLISFFSPWKSLFIAILIFFGFEYALFVMMFDYGLVLNLLFPFLTFLLSTLSIFFMNFLSASNQKEMIRDKFAKKVSPKVAEALIKNKNTDFSADDKEVTIFFSDVRNFTTISEGFSSAHDLIDYLNSYMSPMSDIIIANDGTIDKYIGDAIMAYWNAPVDVDHHADQALKSALEQFRALEHLNISLAEKSLPSIDIGIGIHTGEVVVGEMGSKDRSDYTIIGDSVNLCSRIEGLCKAYGVRLLISEDTLKKVTQNYKIREVDRVQVKGKEESVVIYEVIDFGFFDDKEMQRESKYKEALELYYKNQFLEAGVLFDELFTEYNIKLFKIYANRCQKFLRENIELVGGVYRYDTK